MNAIVAISKNRGIGLDNDLLFHIPGDLKFFKEMTVGKTVVMGRKTLESLPSGKPLPKRTTVVLSGSENKVEGATYVKSIDELFSVLDKDSDDVMICGGEQIYSQLLPYCKKAYVTIIDKEAEANKFFPDIFSDSDWELYEKSEPQEHDGISYTFNTYINKRI